MGEETLRALRWIVGLLQHHNVQYQISGGFAAKLYGSPRTLNDIDIDIPEQNFATIYAVIEPYIILGPERFQDGKWDCELITLNYRGQEIDICGAETTRISNKARTEMIAIPSDLKDVVRIPFHGLVLPVINPRALIVYKKELDGEHQQVDIDAVERYLGAQKTA